MEECMNVKEIAELFHCSKATVYTWRDKGIIKPVYSSPGGKRESYLKEDIMKLYKNCLKEDKI